MKIPVLLAQIPVSLSISTNLKVVLGVLEYAEPGDLVLFPEGAISGYSLDLSFLQHLDLQQLTSALDKLRLRARQQGIYLWVGSYVQENGQWFNSALGFTPTGEIHPYRKINLATHEHNLITPGSELPIFELDLPTGIVKVGVQICREIRYPEQWGWLARQGVDVFLHLNNATNNQQHLPVWRSHLVSHAASNQRFVISSNAAAVLQNCPTIAISPEGLVLEEIISHQIAFTRVELDLSRISNWYLDQARLDIVAIDVPNNKERRKILRTMKTEKLQADLDGLRANPDLYEETNLGSRTEAFEFIHMIEDMHRLRSRDRELQTLYQQAMILRNQLEQINIRLFAQMKHKIQMGKYTSNQLRAWFNAYTDYYPESPGKPHYGYDNLDSLVAGVFLSRPAPQETLERQPGMIHYQPTPVSVILELIDQVGFCSQDVFFDLGSGLGQVLALVNLLADVRCVGIEYQPSYATYAKQMASEFNLKNVTIINADVRDADYTDGTVFFLFNPFGGRIFDKVMEKLRSVALTRKITIGSYGACTEPIATLTWLKIHNPDTVNDFKLAIFESVVHNQASHNP